MNVKMLGQNVLMTVNSISVVQMKMDNVVQAIQKDSKL